MTLTEAIANMFSKRASSPAQRAVNAGAPDAAENPTDGQKRVGNYRKVHLSIDGFRISIENPKGSVRSGTSPDGTKWSNTLACDYGDIRGTESTDGDPVDIYLSDHPDKGAVFVIDQIDPKTKKFDEHKVMYGFDSVEDAKKTYLACYQKGWGGLGWITPVTKAEFRKWIDSSGRKTKPFHEYVSVKPIVDPIKVKASEEKTAQAKQDDPMEGVPAGVKLRSFIDAPATRTAIMDNVLEAVKNRFPIEDDDVRLELKDVKYEGPTSYTLEQQKQALLGNRRLGCSIAGTWRLTDKKTGQVLDERRDGIIRVPYYTDRGTIINNGNEYTVISQARLSPGVYVRRKQNGELESQFNVANGLGFRIGLNKETGALNMSVGQGHVPLYPILRAMGVSDEDIRKSWGNEVTTVNAGKFDPRAIEKVYARYAGRKADPNLPPTEKAKFISEALAGSGLDPDVVVRTLGLENVTGVTGQVMLRAAQKLLNINRGAEDPDERDNPRFSRYYGVEDMMRERIDKDAGRLTKSMLFRAKRDRSLARIGRNALAPYLDTFLSGSGLAMPGEEANPLSILTQQSRITRLGEGGISSPDLVTPEARNVQGDYLGYVDFISGPESFGIGIDVRAALGTMKGSDHRLYNKMMDLRTGKTRYVALDDAASHTVAFPGQDPKAPRLYAMRKGVPTMVPRDEVDYMVPGFGNTVSMGINMTPMPTAVQTNRMFYSSKFWDQYLPQKEGEVPLVDSLMDDGKTTYSEYYGRKIGCLTAPFDGTVIKANDKEIVVRGKDGQTHTASLVKGLPFNRMTELSFSSQVKKGDEVQKGAILANSNFTDAKTGSMNMGRNLKVAVLPAPENASSYEDAIVISEAAAKKLATSRTYGFEQDTKEGVQVARNKYLAAFPKAYTKEQADTIDENGVVKVGTVLHRDDPMILAIGPKMLSAEDAQLGKLSSVLRNALTDKSQKWEHDWPGVVTDVVAGAHGVKVLVKSEPPVKVGDKLAPEHSLKGVVGAIIPTDKMPRDAVTNEPYDMLMNPMGFLSRVAPAQIMLMNLAKVAKKTGKQIRIPQVPPPEGWMEWTEKQMAENGIKPTADVFDPQTGRTIKNVGDGYAYIKAFHHLAEKKFSARGVEGAYTQDEQPAKGGHDGAKRVSGFDALSLLSHGATDVLKDSMTLRGTRNDEYWRRYRLGLPVDEPGVPFIYKKFINTLKAGGVNVVEKGDVTSIMPQTDADIDELAQGRVLETSQMVDSDFQPVKGGMFDLGKTGGMGGNRWSMIVLPESVPNPMMEEPVRRVLGLTAKKMEAVLSGREELNGKTGGDAIKDALSKINVDAEIEKARAEIKNRRGSQRDNAIKVLGYLKAAKEMGKKPEDWMISRVPVLPPMFRPIAKMGDVALVPDMNELYKDLIEMKDNYEALSKELPASALADERLAVYGAVKAAYGLGDPITTEGRAKNLKGAVRQVIGQIPKFGQFQSKVVSKTQDLVGRSVITPNRNLDMDQIGIPEEMAWEIFKPFVERKLVQRGYSPVTVKNMIDERNATAKHILEDVMEERPVLMDRAPTWHKFNIMAFKPHITEGRSIQVSPLCTTGFNADFDGNCVDYDSLITVRLSKSTLDKEKKICDNTLHNPKDKEYAMTDENTSVRIIDDNKVEMTIKIGTFPRVGEPRIDKNGAMVYAVPEGIEVLSVDPVTGERTFETVTLFTHEKDCETVKVNYGSKSVIVSSNESLAVFDSKEGRLVRVKPSADEKRMTPVLVSSTDKFGSFGDRDLGWLFGAFISDGWSSDKMIGYTKLEKCKREEFVRILRSKHENFNLYEYEGHKGQGNKLGNSVKIHCNGRSVAEWLHQWKFIHDDFKNANGKRASLFKMIDPILIESGSEEFLWGLLSGLLDGDGNIACNMHTGRPRYTFRFNTSSPYLKNDLCRLMHKLGLRYSVTTVKARGWSNESYVVYPSTVDMFGKIEKLSCIGEDELSRIGGFSKTSDCPKDDADMVPVSLSEMEALRFVKGFKVGGSLYNTLIRTRKQGAMRGGRANLMKIIDGLKEDDATKALAERVLNTNTKWVQISSVEPAGKREVFDLEVATTKTFVINDGVVVWDTVNIHVPASEKAAKQALEKMLPSKNLFSLTDMKSVRYKPEKEQISGLWALTRGKTRKPTRYFSSKTEAIAAYRNGEIGPNDPIEIKERLHG